MEKYPKMHLIFTMDFLNFLAHCMYVNNWGEGGI